MERIKTIGEELDVRALETIKLFLLQKSGLEDVQILFDHREEGKLIFHIMGLKEDEVAITAIPEELYRKTLDSIDERAANEEFAYLYTPPYISINKIRAEKEEL